LVTTPSRSAALALIAAGSALALTRPARAQGAPIRIAAQPAEIFSEAVYVTQHGLLEKAGLSAQIMPFTTRGQTVQAVLGGSLDVGLSDMTQIANATNRGLPLAFIAGSGLYRTESPSTLLCVAKNSPIRTAKELEGAAIGVNGLRTMAEISTREWARENGADVSKLQFTEIPASLAVPALLRGTVPAAIVGEPFFTNAGDQIRLLAKTYDTISKRFYVSGRYAKRDWLAQNAAAVKKFVAAVYETAQWANTHHDETAPLLATWLKLDVAQVKSTPRAAFATSLDPKLMQPVLDIALRYNVIEKPVDAATLIWREG
jgi:NitT/TauT family transport system substrate-binding protein